MIRNEVFVDGVCVSAEVIDAAAGTLAIEEYGVIVATRPLTAEEVAAHTPAVDPRADLIAQVDLATTVTKLRAVVREALIGGVL